MRLYLIMLESWRSLFYYSRNHSARFAGLLIAKIIARIMLYGFNSREVLHPQHSHNIFIINHRWLVVTGSNLNLTLRVRLGSAFALPKCTFCVCCFFFFFFLLFSNFFIKNGSHGIIYTFKNYFAAVFFSFQFQFSTVSKRTLRLIFYPNNNN